MKKGSLLVIFILFAALAFAQHTKMDLVGRWEGADETKKVGALIFRDTTTIALAIDGNTSPDFNYRVDLTKMPAPLDVVAKAPDGQERIFKCLILFIDNDTIKWQIFDQDQRTEDFNEELKNSIIILKRVKQ